MTLLFMVLSKMTGRGELEFALVNILISIVALVSLGAIWCWRRWGVPVGLIVLFASINWPPAANDETRRPSDGAMNTNVELFQRGLQLDKDGGGLVMGRESRPGWWLALRRIFSIKGGRFSGDVGLPDIGGVEHDPRHHHNGDVSSGGPHHHGGGHSGAGHHGGHSG